MNADRLLAHFERISDAPDAVGRLRRFILELALRGKLVEQDECEEITGAYASEPQHPTLPQAWRLLTFGRHCNVEGGGQPSKTVFANEPRPGYVRLYQIRDLGDKPVPTYIPEKEARSRCKEGDILIGRYGASVGKIFWAKDGAYNVAMAKFIFPPDAFLPAFAFLLLRSQWFQAALANATRSAQAGFNKGDLKDIVLPLPPLAEQHRIVEKVNDLIMLCDRLEASQAERESRTDRLVVASLNRLSQPTAPDEFKKDARFQLSHLSRLSTKPEHIKEIRKAILNLAVRGKLVPQDGREQPFTDHTSDGGDPERRLDMELPAGWRWVQVRDVGDSRLGKMLDKAKNRGKPYRYLRNTNVHWFEIRLEDIKTMPLAAEEANTFLLAPGDVLICEGGHGIARTAVWRGDGEDMAFQKALHRVRPGKSLSGDFLAHCIRVYFDEGVLQRLYTGVGIPHFTGVALSKLIFPLPPLAEQKRIVAKVDELMLICDQLENQLESQQKGRRQLLEALLHEALEGVG